MRGAGPGGGGLTDQLVVNTELEKEVWASVVEKPVRERGREATDARRRRLTLRATP